MPWLFARRSGKAAKLKQRQAAAESHAHRSTTNTTTASDALRRPPSQHSARPRRGHSPSSASLRGLDTHALPTSTDDITALPRQRRLQHSPHLRPVMHDHAGIPYNFHSPSHASLPPTARDRGKLQRPQSLRRDPATESSLVRRKSSRKRKDHDHVREEEIRAMTFPMPQKRPAANSGGMLRRDSKKVKGALNHRFERPTSNVSLPLEDSIHSSMSGNSELRAFRVSAFDMFSPRPTIRFSLGSQHYAEHTAPTGYGEKTDPPRDRRPISSGRDDMQSKRSSRIDDLADTLDAGALREIMERDKRRREKKAKADNERLRRRLERRAEKQNSTEVGGTPAVPRREAMGAVGLGIEKEESMPMEDVRPSTPQQPHSLELLPVTPRTQDQSQLPSPLESPIEEPVVSDARAIRYSRGSVFAPGHSRGPSNVSELPELISEKLAQETPLESVEQVHDPTRSGSLHPVDTVETAATSRWSSTRRRSSDGKRMSVFASLFRLGKRKSQDQGRTTPSEVSFSNTSRESMPRQPLPLHLVGPAPTTPPMQVRRPSSVPRRTMSKFREDLPEFPISPPDSRVQSPEVPSTSTIAARRRSQALSDRRMQSVSQPGARSDSPVSLGANIMSQSLASVDSEASWLSGKPIKRTSNRSQMRSSMASSAVQPNQDFNHSYEELGMADDEYFRRLTPQPDELRRSTHSSDILGRKASSTLMTLDVAAESEEEEEAEPQARRPSAADDDDELVQSVIGRQPTIIHRQARVKSTEGLLDMFLDEKAYSEEKMHHAVGAEPETPGTPASDSEPVIVQRAKSVDFGKQHARHLSAGSARLLDIQKRSSTTSHSRTLEQE